MQKLTTCADCGEQISCTARVCPHCGRVTDPTMEGNRKASYRAAGKLMERVAVGFFSYRIVCIIGISGSRLLRHREVNWCKGGSVK